VDDGRVLWYELDLPEVIALRRRLFEETARHRTLARSALDPPDVPRIAAGHRRIEAVRRLDPVAGHRRRLGLIGLLSLSPALIHRFGGSIAHSRLRET
jgi:hypothetical protein